MANLTGWHLVIILAIVLLLFGGVVSRYVFPSPIAWIDETVSMAFIWVGMIGILGTIVFKILQKLS